MPTEASRPAMAHNQAGGTVFMAIATGGCYFGSLHPELELSEYIRQYHNESRSQKVVAGRSTAAALRGEPGSW
jgi:hypothetical protein